MKREEFEREKRKIEIEYTLKKSIAFKLTFNDLTKTLTDDEVMNLFTKIMDDITKKFNALVRDK